MAQEKLLKLPYLRSGQVALTKEAVLRLDVLARNRLRKRVSDKLSVLELLTQAELEGLHDVGDDDWEVDVLNWPLVKDNKKDKANDTEFLFTRAELEAWLVEWEQRGETDV